MGSERLRFGVWSEQWEGLALQLWGNEEVTRLIGGPFNDQQMSDRLRREIRSQLDHGV